jgi:hypothetical protein
MLLAFTELALSLAPPLYVGEVSRLPLRVHDHLSGQSGFAQRLAQKTQLQWRDLTLWYVAIGKPRGEDDREESKERRALLESIVTLAAVAGYVERVG